MKAKKQLKKLLKNLKKNGADYDSAMADYRETITQHEAALDSVEDGRQQAWLDLALRATSQYNGRPATDTLVGLVTKVLTNRMSDVLRNLGEDLSGPAKAEAKQNATFEILKTGKAVDEAKADPASAIIKGLEAGRYAISDKVDAKIASQVETDRVFDKAALSIRTAIANNEFTEDQQVAVLLESLNKSGQHLRSASARRAYDQALLYIEESAKQPLKNAVVALATRPLKAKKR